MCVVYTELELCQRLEEFLIKRIALHKVDCDVEVPYA